MLFAIKKLKELSKMSVCCMFFIFAELIFCQGLKRGRKQYVLPLTP